MKKTISIALFLSVVLAACVLLFLSERSGGVTVPPRSNEGAFGNGEGEIALDSQAASLSGDQGINTRRIIHESKEGPEGLEAAIPVETDRDILFLGRVLASNTGEAIAAAEIRIVPLNTAGESSFTAIIANGTPDAVTNSTSRPSDPYT